MSSYVLAKWLEEAGQVLHVMTHTALGSFSKSRSSMGFTGHLEPGGFGGLRLRIVFIGPFGADEDWWLGRNWDLAVIVPKTSVERDAGGVMAQGYGVRTSGHLLVYAADGSLRFIGGLAPARNGSQDRDGSPFDLATLFQRSASGCVRRPVRGCPLFDE